MSAPNRRTLIEEMVRNYSERLEAQIPDRPLTLEEIETLVEDLGREQNSSLEERLIREQAPPPTNQATCPHCAGVARYKTVSERHVLTIHGSRLLRRRYYTCNRCDHGFAPLDQQLQVVDRSATPRVRAWEAKLASKDPFVEVPETLRELRGLVVSESTIERTTIEVGTALRAAQKREWEAMSALAPSGAAPSAGTELPVGTGPVRRGPGVGRLYLGVDGVFCPLRDPWCKDGSRGKLNCRYGEAKVAMVYQTKQRDGLDEGIRWCAYAATLQKVEAFTREVVGLARAHGSDRALELIFLGDGAEWIWNLCRQHFPQALQILDYWHMTEHLYAVANAQFGKGSEAAAEWVHDCQWYLERDVTSHVLNQIAAWQPEGAEDQELRDREHGYFERNQERMRYGTFVGRGYHIGSGSVESGCKRLVTRRMKEAGMHWREETAEAMLAIRARLHSTGSKDLRAYA
jgi:hypothetical protein